MANKTWTGTSGDWNTGSLWSGGTVPGTADTAIFGGTLSYQAEIGLHGGTADTVANVTLTDANASLQIDSGSSLAVTGVFSLLAGDLSLNGVLSGGTLLGNGGSLAIGGGTLSHDTIAGTVQAGGYFATLDVIGGLAFQTGGVLSLTGGSGDELAFLDRETLTSGVIVTQDYGDTLAATAGAVTFASGFTLDVDNATTLTGSFVNQGKIVIGSFDTLTLAPASFTNSGIIDLGQYAQIDLGSLTTAQLTALAGGISNAGGEIGVQGHSRQHRCDPQSRRRRSANGTGAESGDGPRRHHPGLAGRRPAVARRSFGCRHRRHAGGALRRDHRQRHQAAGRRRHRARGAVVRRQRQPGPARCRDARHRPGQRDRALQHHFRHRPDIGQPADTEGRQRQHRHFHRCAGQ